MKIANTFTLDRFSLGTLVVLLCWLSAVPTRAAAQCNTSQGFNVVYGNCNGGQQIVRQGTYAMVDANQFATTSNDICIKIQTIFNTPLPPGPNQRIVVDARGVPLPSGQSIYPCSVNPWGVSPEPLNSTVLLPAGTIVIQTAWTLPKNARLIGQGPNLTVLRACTTQENLCGSNFQGDASNAMIEMGVSAECNSDCPAVKVEHLGLDGNSINGVNVTGIFNDMSQELSGVDDVSLYNIAGTGLLIQGTAGTQVPSAQNSGPYSNIYFNGPGKCVGINATPTTRGIHGLTCISTATSSSAAIITVDGNNNTIEDVYIQGGPGSSQDGIRVGSLGVAQGNVLFNVTGVGLGNVIELSNAEPNEVYNVDDVTIVGVTNLPGGGTTVQDDLPGGASIADAKLGMYVVGEPVQDNTSGNPNTIGYSRFTTSINAATWIIGPNFPSGNCGVGSLYSCTSSASNCTQGSTFATLWGCGGSPPGQGGAWYAIK